MYTELVGNDLALIEIRMMAENDDGVLDVSPIQADNQNNEMLVLTDKELAEQYLAWVRRNFVKVSKVFGTCFEGLEQRMLSLLAELEINFLEAEREKEKGKKSGNKRGTGRK